MIGIIGAMHDEVELLQEEMQAEEIVEKAGMLFHKGVLCGKEVVVVQSGIGKVNAALCAQILVDVFEVDTLINTGIAGSLDAQIDIGDMVISTDAVQHDVDTTVFGDPYGQIPNMDTFSFPADEKLVKLAKQVNEEANPDIQTFTGRIVSGDQFIASNEKIKWLRDTFNAYCTEMEGASVAHVCYTLNVPFVIIRAISDKANHEANVDYGEFVKVAAKNSKTIVEGILRKI